jgi:hypothetical protein
MGERTNGLVTNIFGVIGFLLLLAIAIYVATVKIPEGLQKIGGGKTVSIQETPCENSIVIATLNKPTLTPGLSFLENDLS